MNIGFMVLDTTQIFALNDDIKDFKIDGASKNYPKLSRRREPSTSNASRQDQSRKAAPNKSKALDKRPRPRGPSYYGGKESSQVEECEDELGGSVYSSGRKKQNHNHLLNFHYAPRGQTVWYGPKPSYQNGVRWLMATHKHKYNKEHYLQARCQFVVRSGVDFNPYLVDPDKLVNWDSIEQIILASVEPVTCPICLFAPVAAKITRCGHVYCCTCMLRHLDNSDDSWAKCPICFEAVHKNDLKSVRVEYKQVVNVGQEITFQLMMREKGSLMACPVSQFDIRTTRKPVLSVSETDLDKSYAKIFSINLDEVRVMIDCEIRELLKEKAKEQETIELLKEKAKEQWNKELQFIDKALDLCTSRMQSLNDDAISPECVLDNLTLDENKNGKEEENTEISARELNERPRYETVSSDGDDISIANITPEDLEGAPPTGQAKHYYFYQAIDGQQIYLHAVNVKMLELNYGHLRDCPAKLTGVIVEKESGTMTPKLRGRLRYMQHLPVTTQFEVAEIKLQPPLVSQLTLDAFKDELEKRRESRRRKVKEELKRERIIAEVELRQMGRHATPRLQIDSIHHFPQCGSLENENPPLVQRAPSRESSRDSSPSSHSPRPPATTLLPSENSSPSFAQMLRSGAARPVRSEWPKVDAEPQRRVVESVDSDGESAPAPGYQESFRHGIAAAFELASTHQEENRGKGGGKKKRKKHTMLFTTGMACTSK